MTEPGPGDDGAGPRSDGGYGQIPEVGADKNDGARKKVGEVGAEFETVEKTRAAK